MRMNLMGGGERVWVNAVRTEVMKAHTIAEWMAEPEERRLELVDGEFVEKAAPDITHGLSQAQLITAVSGPFSRPAGHGGAPGGWWIASEVDVRLGKDGFRPDVCGWRRDRVASMPRTRPVELAPDWICEVLSESNRANDTVRKLRRYHQAGVEHYWLLDPASGMLSVFRHEAEGYLNVLTAERHQVIRATPFDAVELRVAVLLGDDPA
jgi:Uma2 family endonuclease